jgi:hypothetical protein
MAGALHAASQRINDSVAGLTGQVHNPSQEPGAPAAASPVEVIDHLPTEFGGLTHLFGGGGLAEAPTQFAPVNVGKEIPAGSVRGVLGGLAPDVRNTATHSVATAKKVTVPLSESVRTTVAKARAALRI